MSEAPALAPATATIAYESPRAVLYHGDIRQVPLERRSVDLLVTDPPYGQGYVSGKRTATPSFGTFTGDAAGEADSEMIIAVLTTALVTLGQHRHVYVFGPAELLAGLKLSASTELIWDKGQVPGGGDFSAIWGKQHEPISFALNHAHHGGTAGRDALPVRMRKGTVLNYRRLTGRKVSRHPTEKPIELLAEFIESSSRPGEIVLDPFVGSGSTMVAAILEGRRAMGFEIDRRFIDVAVRRLRWAERLADMRAENGEAPADL